MNVLSLFDGISCGQIALNRANIPYDNYFASEIDVHAIKVTQHNYPNTKQLGDITKISGKDLPKIDLLIGGSPCQSFSNAGKGEGFNGKSGLFWEYVRLLNECKPKYFLLENVPMSKNNVDIISKLLCVNAIIINSNLVSIQNRKRLYWTNIPNVEQPEDQNLLLRNLFCNKFDRDLILTTRGLNKLNRPRNRVIEIENDKTPTLMKSQEKKPTDSIVFKHNDIYRYPTRRECELMQTVPIGYTNVINYRLATGMLGNGWTVNVITVSNSM
jgi:site-specific DNA-cytosine methylase